MMLPYSALGSVGLSYAMEQDVFPVRFVMWGLFMLSLLSWAVIVSKSITLLRSRSSDAAFVSKVRVSKRPLDLYEADEEGPESPASTLYRKGAREATYHLLKGGPAPADGKVKGSACLSQGQMRLIQEAFLRGEDEAALKLRSGFSILNAAYIGAPFLGLLGALWVLMSAFSSVGEGADLIQLSPAVSGALGILVTAVLVATPAVFAQIILHAIGRERLKVLGDFRVGLSRWFEYGLAAKTAAHDAEYQGFPATAQGESSAAVAGVGRRKRRQLGPIFDRMEDSHHSYSEPEINPIARQTALQSVQA
ncbi:MAG: MotA/TolQ/ExbB proton channel family protein [Verrucomicrobiales bacterium]|nr:MotA/TolQ/ExbB proton channel family protein [Verrucomicrobiales bacterium]